MIKQNIEIFIKTILDFILAFWGIIILSPVYLYIAYKIKKEDGGKTIYAYDCIGKNGKVFKCYKFRSMIENSQEVLKKYLDDNLEARIEWETFYKLKNDPRITKIGAKLRKSSLDELPQLFNVLKGDMSLVGPRQIVKGEIMKFGKYIDLYYSVKPGITGYWQVCGRSEVDYKTRVKMTVWYINNWSLWLDVKILIKTVSVVLKKTGAY